MCKGWGSAGVDMHHSNTDQETCNRFMAHTNTPAHKHAHMVELGITHMPAVERIDET
jgi:hypothetical protein